MPIHCHLPLKYPEAKVDIRSCAKLCCICISVDIKCVTNALMLQQASRLTAQKEHDQAIFTAVVGMVWYRTASRALGKHVMSDRLSHSIKDNIHTCSVNTCSKTYQMDQSPGLTCSCTRHTPSGQWPAQSAQLLKPCISRTKPFKAGSVSNDLS